MTQSIFPVIAYKDVAAAIEWLSATFGFEVKSAEKRPDGTVGHAEMKHGQSLFMLSEEGEVAPAGGSVYVHVPEIDAHYERARAVGAEITYEITDQPYGSREYGARDLEGRRWYFGTYRPE